MERKVLFIGHAAPEDNEFALWLYSRLRLMGYDLWCDLENLHGGERDFWENIQDVIRQKSAKYLLVFSKSSFKKDGVKDEFEFARAVAKECNLQDFIIPLRIEDVAFNDRIGMNRYNVIDFTESWAHGLDKLVAKLKKDKVERQTTASADTDKILNSYLTQPGFVRMDELYYSNWWPIENVPAKFYIFRYANEKQAQAILEETFEYPKIKHGNYLASFERNIPTSSSKNGGIEIIPLNVNTIQIDGELNGDTKVGFPNLTDRQNITKRLLKRAFINLMYEKGLVKKELSNKRYCFFYPKGRLDKDKVTVWYHNRKKTKKLVGKHRKDYWHFGVSSNVLLEPTICFNLKSHVLFSTDGHNIWESASKLHSARRNKCRRWFNEEWRDCLMAFLFSLKRDDENVELVLAEDFKVELPLFTQNFHSDVGYRQPETKSRLNVLYEFENEIIDDEDDDAVN